MGKLTSGVEQAEKEIKPIEDTNRHISIAYTKPFFHRRIFAGLIDVILLVIVWLLMFISFRALATTFPGYKSAYSEINAVQLSSGLYTKEDDGQIVTVVTHYTNDSDSYTSEEIKDAYSDSLESFLAYIRSDISEASYKAVKDNYDGYRLDENLAYNGVKYFVEVNGDIAENPECTASYAMYSSNVYVPYIQNKAYGYLSSLNVSYYNATRYVSNMLFFFELPCSVIVSSLIVLYVPGLFFRRGRKTIGRLVYHIGRLDKNCLSVSFRRYTAESMIMIFGIIVLSFLTLGVPLIISFSMMAFSKKKQDFPDYMLDITEVDDQREKIYFSKEEILLESLKKNKKGVDFQMEGKPE